MRSVRIAASPPLACSTGQSRTKPSSERISMIWNTCRLRVASRPATAMTTIAVSHPAIQAAALRGEWRDAATVRLGAATLAPTARPSRPSSIRCNQGAKIMNVIRLYRPPMWPRLVLAAAIIGALGIAGAAYAGECPSDKRVADGKGQPPGPSAPSGVTDVVRASTDLAKEPLALQGRQFRLRQLEMQPGGVVPWHSHNERPAMIYVVSGEVVEY